MRCLCSLVLILPQRLGGDIHEAIRTLASAQLAAIDELVDGNTLDAERSGDLGYAEQAGGSR